MLCTLHPTQLPLPPGLYIPNLEHNRDHLPRLISEPNERCAVVLSRITPELESTHFNQGYIQLLPIEILEDTTPCDNLVLKENPVLIFPAYLSSFYNIKDKDEVVIFKCKPPPLSNVVLVAEDCGGMDRKGILQLIVSQSDQHPIPCQLQSTLVLPAPDTREIQVCEPERPHMIGLRVLSAEPFPYGYILPHTVIELKVEIKLPKEHQIVRFIPHGGVDTSAIMLSQRDAACFGVGEGDWVEFEVKQCLPLNLFEGTEWLKIPQIDLVSSPIKRISHVVIVHEREVKCLQNSLSDHIQEDLFKEAIICYVSSLCLITNSPFHPHWYAFYGDITVSQMPLVMGDKVSIRQVTMPHIETEEAFNDDLEQYFATPRLLRKGDLLCVPLEATGREDIFYTVESVEVAPEMEKEAGELIWTNAVHSTLTQSGYTNAFIPHCFSFKSFYDVPFLYGFERCFAQLLRYLYPLACLSDNPHAYLNNGVILEGKPGSGKQTVARCGARLFSMNFTTIDCHELVQVSPSDAEAQLVTAFSSARRCRPCVLFISDLQLLSKSKHGGEDGNTLRLARYLSELVKEYSKVEGPPLAIIGSATSTEDLIDDIQSVFLNKVSVTPLREREVLRALQLMTARMLIAPSVDLKNIVMDCHRFGLGDVKFLVDEVNLTSISRTMDILSELDMEFLPYHNLTTVITTEDLTSALDHLSELRGKLVGVSKVPNVLWEDIGGLEKVKEEVLRSLSFSRAGNMSPALQMFKRCGLLLYGPPGCGKTLLAKAIATECKSKFINVKGPEILDKYVGQSEQNIRNIFDDAIESAPCIIFFDEVDSIAPRRGGQGDSGGVMDRVSAQLLTELDRVSGTPDVYVVAATNRPDLLDPALLRPGRFDRSLHVGFSETAEDIEKVFRAITKKFNLSEDVDLREFSQALTGTFSGSQIYSICYEAMMNGLRRKIAELEAQGRSDADESIVTTREDFVKAMKKLSKSNT